MSKSSIAVRLSLVLALAGSLSACGTNTSDDPATASTADHMLAATSRQWTVFADPFKDGSPNPAANIGGMVLGFVWDDPAVTTISMIVQGLEANKTFGAHLHKLSCADTQGGGHFQHDPTAGASATNEIWLDFTPNAGGVAFVNYKANYSITADQAKSIVVHAQPTNPVDGKAGPKLACIDVQLQPPPGQQ